MYQKYYTKFFLKNKVFFLILKKIYKINKKSDEIHRFVRLFTEYINYTKYDGGQNCIDQKLNTKINTYK